MIRIDVERSPLLFVEFRGALTNADADAYLELIGTRISMRERFGLVLHAVDVPVPNLATIKRISDWMRTHNDEVMRCHACLALQLESAALRGVLKFFNTIVAPACPQAVFSDAVAAEAWVRAQLAREGLMVPPASQRRPASG